MCKILWWDTVCHLCGCSKPASRHTVRGKWESSINQPGAIIQSINGVFFWYDLTQVVQEKGCKTVLLSWQRLLPRQQYGKTATAIIRLFYLFRSWKCVICMKYRNIGKKCQTQVWALFGFEKRPGYPGSGKLWFITLTHSYRMCAIYLV